MKISVFGLGYVGCVSSACLAARGHEVIGVDVSALKVEIIGGGRSPIVEPGIEALIGDAVNAGRLRATSECARAVAESEISLVCVGTPSNPNGSLDLSYIERVCREIGEAIHTKVDFHIIAIRSTMLPGSVEGVVIPALESTSGKKAGRDFGVAINPEFLREGTSIKDFNNPPFTLIGADDEKTAAALRSLYADIDAPVITIGVKEAEMVKYASNCYHALKVTFANEIGAVCKAMGVDSHEVMEVFCRDTKLNVSSAYLKPGFAFGGSCLPKDLRAITYKAKEMDVDVPVLSSIMASNDRQVDRAARMVLGTGRKRVAVLGLSFKSGTDDLRESPMVSLIETLIGKGLKLTVYDRDVEMARLFGANRDYIEREIPHISSLMHSELNEVINRSEVIIIGKKEEEFHRLSEKLDNGRVVIDLVRMLEVDEARTGYEGVCW
ncbi:MAG TPA: UDP-glucose/GDP-mannose dehydrogenase family protein [Blastocatellia bacterium]|nr:UDP-glucose/GDP-mannose dehydrogenase family protein [Blastocatellia bacterium]